MFRRNKTIVISVLTPLTLGLLMILFFSARQADSSKREVVLLESMLNSVRMMHFDPAPIDDQFSAKVFDHYLLAVDNFKKILTESDITALEKYKRNIDDQINRHEFDFFNDVEKLITERIQQVAVYPDAFLGQPFDFSLDEEIELDPGKSTWCRDEAMLRDEWRKALKYQVMIRIHQELDIRESLSDKDTVVEKKTFDEIESEARDQVKRTYKDYFDRLMKQKRSDRMESYLNAICEAFDPMTSYFAPATRENFDISLSGKLEGIGAVLTQRAGLINVEEILPGSPSWKQGELKVGDVILKVAQGDAESVDVTSMRLDEAVKLIRGKKGSAVKLTVRKKVTDDVVVIKIIRDVVEMEQIWARSSVIHTKEGKKVGYIYLPRFYADFNNPYTGRFCADDVRKEIMKLNKESVDAIVFDLRNNGGGSLADVVKMSGFFISNGPVVQVKDRIEGVNVMQDDDPTIQFAGPLIIMMNLGSASASEIMASALQDYQRAVIVGSPFTYGKGTVQRLFDLDRLTQQADKSLMPLGTLKLTTQKFYRINGGSTQIKGVTPDIILPDQYMFVDQGERGLENAMPWTKIKPVPYKEWNGPYGDIVSLRNRSESRTSTHETFRNIQTYAKDLKAQRKQTSETLNLEKYRAKNVFRKQQIEKLNKLLEEKTGLEILMTEADRVTLQGDTLKARIMNEWIEGLQKDIYIAETTQIMLDMIRDGNKKGVVAK